MPLADCESVRLVEALGNLLRQHTIERDDALKIIRQQDVELAHLRAIETAARTYVKAADAELRYGNRSAQWYLLEWYPLEEARVFARDALVKLLEAADAAT